MTKQEDLQHGDGGDSAKTTDKATIEPIGTLGQLAVYDEEAPVGGEPEDSETPENLPRALRHQPHHPRAGVRERPHHPRAWLWNDGSSCG